MGYGALGDLVLTRHSTYGLPCEQSSHTRRSGLVRVHAPSHVTLLYTIRGYGVKHLDIVLPLVMLPRMQVMMPGLNSSLISVGMCMVKSRMITFVFRRFPLPLHPRIERDHGVARYKLLRATPQHNPR